MDPLTHYKQQSYNYITVVKYTHKKPKINNTTKRITNFHRVHKRTKKTYKPTPNKIKIYYIFTYKDLRR